MRPFGIPEGLFLFLRLVPGRVTCYGVACGYQTVSWTPPSDSDFAGVEIVTDPVTVTTLVAKGTNSATITGLTNGTGYLFTIRALDETGNRSPGASISKTPMQTFILTVIKSGSGTGTISSDPAGINYGTVNLATFDDGTVVTLTATGDAGSVFVGWSGSGCSGLGPADVTMNGNKTVTGTFNSF